MKPDQRFQLASAIYRAAVQATTVRLADIDILDVQGADIAQLVPQLENSGALLEMQGQGGAEGLRISLRYNGWLIYYDDDEFLTRANLQSFLDDIAILRFRDEGLVFFSSAQNTLLAGGPNAAALLTNARCYLRLLELLNAHKEIASYHDTILRQYILLSPKHGKMVIGYSRSTPNFTFPLEHCEHFTKLARLANSTEFRMFFRDEIVSQLEDIQNEHTRMEVLYKRLPALVEAAERDFEVYRTQFSFADLKQHYRTERENYFAQMRDVTRTLGSQVVAIPVSISAGAIAIYNLRENTLLVGMLVVTYQLFSLYLVFQLGLVRSELHGIQSDVNADEREIRAKSDALYSAFKPEMQKVSRRVQAVTKSLLALVVTLWAVASYLLVFYHFTATVDSRFTSLALLFTTALHCLVYWLVNPAKALENSAPA
jgi:hypothetical protein